MRILVYCGSKSGNNPLFVRAAEDVATFIAEGGHSLVYGGGNVGLMGVTARKVLELSGHVTGVIPTFLSTDEVVLRECSELIEVASMHERKLTMIERCDVIVALPGGYGTMDELFEAVTWLQLDLHNKPIGLLNCDGYYDALHQQLQRMVDDGFLSEQNRKLIYVEENPSELLSHLVQRASTGVSTSFEQRS